MRGTFFRFETVEVEALKFLRFLKWWLMDRRHLSCLNDLRALSYRS